MSKELISLLTLVAARGSRAPLALISTALLARLVGPAGIGQWSMIVAAATLLHSVFLNWTQAILVKFGTEERVSTGRLDETYAMRAPLLAAGFALAGVLLWLQPLRWGHRLFGLETTGIWLVAGYLGAMFLLAELQTLMRVDDRYRQLAFVPTLAEAFTVVSLYTFLLLRPVSGMVAMAIMALSPLTFGIAGAWIEWRRLAFGRLRISLPRVGAGVAFAWPLVPNFSIGYLSDWSDHLILQQFLATPEVGVFQAAYAIMLLLVSLSAPVATVLLPRLLAQNLADPTMSRRYVDKVVPTLIILWLPGAAVAAAAAPSALLMLYGREFAPSMPVMAVLCIAVPGSILSTLYGPLFLVQDRLARPTVYLAVMAGINIVLSLVFVPIVGVIGAAIGTAISYLIVQGLYLRDQHAYLGVPVLAPAVLFGTATMFGLAQGFFVETLPSRLALAFGFTGIVIGLARWLRVVDAPVLSRLFPNRLAWITAVLTRVLVATPR